MATTLTIRTRNQVDTGDDVPYSTNPGEFITMDLTNDYLIWTAGNDTVKDHMTHEPTADELNEAATIIDENSPTTVALCLLMDYSHDVQGSYYTHQVFGMGDNKRYVFCFSFDGMTAMIPRLEAWDNEDHDSYDNHVLGNGTPANSMVKAVCTTNSAPGAGWSGVPLAGEDNYLELDETALEDAKDLYANVKIVIPAAYDTPAAESFVLCVRYTYI